MRAARQPLILRGSTPADREARAQQLANLFVGELVPLLVQVRKDFLEKERDELIFNCKTFTQYCNQVLRYSESHIRRLIAGHNPATEIFDGSQNRKPALEDTDGRTLEERMWDSGIAQRTLEHDPVLFGLYMAQTKCVDMLIATDDRKWLRAAAKLEGRIVRHICGGWPDDGQ
jgi:hypothetical protein